MYILSGNGHHNYKAQYYKKTTTNLKKKKNKQTNKKIDWVTHRHDQLSTVMYIASDNVRHQKHCSKILHETLLNCVSNDLFPLIIGLSHDEFLHFHSRLRHHHYPSQPPTPNPNPANVSFSSFSFRINKNISIDFI
jgi:hypothetical protein